MDHKDILFLLINHIAVDLFPDIFTFRISTKRDMNISGQEMNLITRNLFTLYLLNKIIDTDLGPKIQDLSRTSPMNSVGDKYTHRTRKIVSIVTTVLITKKSIAEY